MSTSPELQPQATQPPARRRRPPRALPLIDDVMKKPYFIIEDIAALMQTTVYGVRTKQKCGTIPAPVGKRGRRWYWNAASFLAWFEYGDGPVESWTPPPYGGPRPPNSGLNVDTDGESRMPARRTPPRGTPPIAGPR